MPQITYAIHEVSASALTPEGNPKKDNFAYLAYLNVEVVSKGTSQSEISLPHPSSPIPLTIPSSLLSTPESRKTQTQMLILGLIWFFGMGAVIVLSTNWHNGYLTLAAFLVWYFGFTVIQIFQLQYLSYRKTGKFEKLNLSFNPSITLGRKTYSLRP